MTPSPRPERQSLDRWLIRAKDIIIIFAAVLSFAGYGMKLYKLPGVQEAQAVEIKAINNKITAHDTDIAVLSTGINDIKALLLNKGGVREIHR